MDRLRTVHTPQGVRDRTATSARDGAGEVAEVIPASDSGLPQDLTELCAALTA